MDVFQEAEFWVAVAFVLLIALFVYMKIPAKVIAMLEEFGFGFPIAAEPEINRRPVEHSADD